MPCRGKWYGLKKRVEEAKDRKEAKDILAQAGIFLTDEELDQVSGGTNTGYAQNGRTCPTCGSAMVKFTGERGDMGAFTCEKCGCTFYADV